MTKLTAQTEDNLVRARVVLMELFPFWGELAKFLRPQLSETFTETACVDRKGRMFLNPNFANKATAQDLLFVLAHEVMHIVDSSSTRFPEGGNFQLWARAADIAINYLIVCEGDIKLPRPELVRPLHEDFSFYWNMTHEEIYQDLMRNPIMARNAMRGNLWCDEESCGCMAEMDESEKEKWQRRIESAAEVAKGRGMLPDSLDRFVAKISKARKNWVRVLALAMQSELRKSYTWRHPSRRTAALGLVTPSSDRELPDVVLYLDTSGSMHEQLLNEGLSEIAAILRVAKTTMILGDSEIYFCGKVSLDELNNLPMQRGGTDFNCVFDKINEMKLKPRLFVGFSDLDGGFPDQPPSFPTIWCRSSGSTTEPPWGKLITM